MPQYVSLFLSMSHCFSVCPCMSHCVSVPAPFVSMSPGFVSIPNFRLAILSLLVDYWKFVEFEDISKCVRCPHWLSSSTVNNQIAISSHDQSVRRCKGTSSVEFDAVLKTPVFNYFLAFRDSKPEFKFFFLALKLKLSLQVHIEGFVQCISMMGVGSTTSFYEYSIWLPPDPLLLLEFEFESSIQAEGGCKSNVLCKACHLKS